MTARVYSEDGIGHYRLYGPILTFRVRGLPIGQGRISFLGKGRPAIHSNQDRLLPWRELVQHAAEAAIRDARESQPDWFPLAGPVGLYACFTMSKPKSAPKTKPTFPVTRPDASHLLRAVEDAITNAGVWHDDSQLVDEHVVKAYPGEHVQALEVPGVVIRVYTVGAA